MPRSATYARRSRTSRHPNKGTATSSDRCYPTRVSVVLPVYGNRAQLPELHARLTRTLRAAGLEYELVFVEDAGADGSLAWLRQLAAEDRQVRVVAMPHNVGQHRAVLEGLRAGRGDACIVMDADLQDPPEQIPVLLGVLRPTDGAVMARRRASYQSRGRHITGRAFKALLRGIRVGIPAGTGMFLAMSSVALDRVIQTTEERPYIPLLLARTGLPMRTVDIPKEASPGARSAYTPMRRLVMGARAVGQAVRWRILDRGQ